jgi:superfamily II DNA or RNA helicase
MYRPESLIIDNNKLKLFEELNKILQEQKSVDVATAYFNIAGFQLIKDAVLKTEKFRLLLGVCPERDGQYPDVFIPEEIYRKSIRIDLEEDTFEKEEKEAMMVLVNFLKSTKVEIKLFKNGFLHGKVYIFDKLAIIGSSNLTYAGFTSNTELNAVLDEAHSRYIKEEWFERIWNDSINYKDEFINILDSSKFGTKEYPPYHIFIKTLYELQKDDILFEFEAPSGLPASEVDLTNFQEDAVKRIYSRLNTYDGVLVADSVGLGKTWIAKKVIEDFGFYRRQRFVVICPAGVDETLWRPALKSIGVSENIIHQEELGRENFDFNYLQKGLGFKLDEIALFIIDESHNFRNPLSNRYESLFTLIERASVNNRPKILLLTATPMNNTHWDLYFQLMLIARNEKRLFVKEGVFDLERQFKKADKGDLVQIADILQIIAIRRTRQYIKENYSDARYKDESGNWVIIKFPKRELHEINYSLNETYQGLYHQIAEKIEKNLTLAYYRLEEYRTAGTRDVMELGRMKALGGILQTILLKRLESSVEAFRISIQSQIAFHEAFKKFFKQGKIIKKKFYDKYLASLEYESEFSANLISALENNLESIKMNDFNADKLLQDLSNDISIFNDILALINPINEAKDAKLIEFKKQLLNTKEKGKAIVFSFYADTIDYLYKALTNDSEFSKAFGRKIAKVTGSFPAPRRKVIMEEFLNSNLDLLLSTDILSEGQNLQKARCVINYDLHWNPVRMIQRAGRIDRIGSPFDEIMICNFYPEKELESLLELVKILANKIQMINDTVGLDASVLGEKINPRVFGIIRDLRGSKATKEKVLQELEEEQFGGGESFWQPLKDFGLDNLKEFCEALPSGIQSGLKKDFRGLFFYYQYDEDCHLWYLYDVANDIFINNKTKILEFIACKTEEPRIISQDLDIFEVHDKVRSEIKKFLSEGLVTTQLRTSVGRMDNTFRNLRDELDFIAESYSTENNALQEKVSTIISNLHNIAWTKKRMQSLRKIGADYKTSKNWNNLLIQLSDFLSEKVLANEQEPVKFDEKKLRLICVDFIS